MVLLIACYELGHQPLTLGWPLAFLEREGIDAASLDLAVQPFDDGLAAQAEVVAISVPMLTALRIGVEAARRVRALNPGAHICFFGMYAWLNEDYLLDGIADSVIAGEYETGLIDLIKTVRMGNRLPAQTAGVSQAGDHAQPVLNRLPFPTPSRAQLQPLDSYARYMHNGIARVSGYTEASRGCLHTCNHCPVVPVYEGRFFIVPQETVLADIRQQVRAGAEHISFGDPDFLNGPKHALAVTRALHSEFPTLTFDFTTKVEHILHHRALFAEFAALGCTFVISAIESVSELVLEKLAKGHTAADIDEALQILDAAGIALQPTLVAFSPWTTLDDYIEQIEWIAERGLAEYIPPIQLSIRLLIPPKSHILNLHDTPGWIGRHDPESFTYRWAHPDARMDGLHAQVSKLVEEADRVEAPVYLTHAKIRDLAYSIAGRTPPRLTVRPRLRPTPPRLSENWFCCAEPTQAQVTLISL
jgi:radical SAM superfamily enzyme YgiQ (UPF0313 family)